MSELSARDATAADYASYARLYAELGANVPIPDQDRWTSEFVARTVFLERQGVIVAYGLFNLYEGSAYVVQLVVDPGVRREGIGRALLDALAARFRRAGCSTWALDVKADNAPAIALYESIGLQVIRRSTSFRLAWAAVERLPRDAREVTARVIAPTEDEALEAAFELPRGQLAVLRTRKGRTQVRLIDVAEPAQIKVGLGIFDPSWPGAFPFRVARPTLAFALLDAVKIYAEKASTIVQLVADGDEALAQILRDVGAEVMVETLYMRGALPAA